MYGATHWAWGPAPDAGQAQAAQNALLLLSGLAFLASWAVLAFFCSLLLNVIDTVFVCYPMVSWQLFQHSICSRGKCM